MNLFINNNIYIINKINAQNLNSYLINFMRIYEHIIYKVLFLIYN